MKCGSNRLDWARLAQLYSALLGLVLLGCAAVWITGYRFTTAGALALGVHGTPYLVGQIASESYFPGGQIVVSKAGDMFHLLLLRQAWGLYSVKGTQFGRRVPPESPLGVLGTYARIGDTSLTAVAVVVQDPRVSALVHPSSRKVITVEKPGLYTFVVPGPYRNQLLEVSALDESGATIARVSSWNPVALPPGTRW